MFKIKFVKKDGEMEIREYTLSHPFNLVSNNNNKTKYSVNSVEYKNIKGSFRIYFVKKLIFLDLDMMEKKKFKMRKLPILKIREFPLIHQQNNYYYLNKD